MIVITVKHIIVSLQLLPCFIALFAPAIGSSKSPQNPPNIILILADDQRWDSVGFMGKKNGQTPYLDQLAKEGYVFENAFVTSAICTPSRVSYFLGQYERKHGVNFNSGTAISQNAWKAAYPNLLKIAGYTTAYIGKNHVPIGADGYHSGHFENSFDFWYAGHRHLGFIPKNDILYSPMPNPTPKPKFSPKAFKLFSIPPHIQISIIQLRPSFIPENQINPSVSRSA